MRLLFDLETNNLYHEVTTIHCIVAKDIDNGKVYKFTSANDECGSIKEGLELLERASWLGGHNIIAYDLPVIKKLYPNWTFTGTVRDTLVLSRLYFTELKRFDYNSRVDKGFPKKLAGKHSLEAWGYRLGTYKDEKPESWEVYTPEMLVYCEKDIEVNHVLLKKLLAKEWKGECVQLEHDVAHIIQLQEKAGFAFNEKKAGKLLCDWLDIQRQFEEQLKAEVPGWFKRGKLFTPKRPNKRMGYTAGGVIQKIEWEPFNPNSRQHLVRVLKEKYGWKPKQFTDAGNAILNEQVLSGLDKVIGGTGDTMLSYLTITKRISQLSEGKSAWLKYVSEEGTIRGCVNPNGCITGRMSHFWPNLSQVPAVYSDYGKECRELFTVREPGNYLVGADADGLELRGLAECLYKYDGGKYRDAVLYGNKEEGTDAHSLTLRALGKLCPDRDTAKTFFYALIYGASDWKLGSILTGKNSNRNSTIGKEARRRVETGIKGLGRLRNGIINTLKKRQRKYKRKWLTGIDGRKIFIRSDHASLNSKIQSMGGVIMKKALVILYNRLTTGGQIHGEDYWFVVNSHDEWEIEVRSHADPEYFGKTMVWAMTEAGRHFNLNVPITGDYKIGKTWAETH